MARRRKRCLVNVMHALIMYANINTMAVNKMCEMVMAGGTEAILFSTRYVALASA